MKKLLLVLAIVVAYGVATSTASAKVVTIDKADVTVVADVNDVDMTTPDGEETKAKDKKAKATCSEECKSSKCESSCGDKKAECKDSKKACCSGEKAEKSCDSKKK